MSYIEARIIEANIRALAIQAHIEGLKVANARRERHGLSEEYPEDTFFRHEEELVALANEVRTLAERVEG